MELIDRYLQAVEFWLPKQQKQDIIAELSEDIHAQVEEQETAFGHPLNEAEVEAILRGRGSPMLVANGYLPRQYLIGPMLFPIYRFILLRVVTLCYLPWVLGWIGLALFGYARASTAGTLWTSLFVTVAMVTLVFTVLERVQAKTHFLEEWNPRKLPALRDPNLIGLSSSYLELVVNVAASAWWAAKMWPPITLPYRDLQIGLGSVWSYFFWGFLLITLLNTALAAANVMHPVWTVRKAAFRLLLDCAGAVLFCWLLKANVVTAFMVTGVSNERAVEIANAINLHLAQVLPGAVVFVIVIGLVDAYRIMRLRTPKVRLTGVGAVAA